MGKVGDEMKRIGLSVLMVILLLVFVGCDDEGNIAEVTSGGGSGPAYMDVAGMYEGTMAFTTLETPEDDSWLDESYDVVFSIEQTGDQITLRAVEEEEVEESNSGTIVGNRATLRPNHEIEGLDDAYIEIVFDGDKTATGFTAEAVYVLGERRDIMTMEMTKVE